MERDSRSGLLARVSTLIQANLNNLIDDAENPERLIKQIILDMENHVLPMKTQVAIAIADQYLLAKKQKENEDKVTEWSSKAELAVIQNEDDQARVAIERSLHYKQLAASFALQVAEQKLQVDVLKNALNNLQQRLDEARSKSDLLLAQHGRARRLAGVDLGLSDFSLKFDSHFSQHQVRALLEALADYYRACGGVGFEIDFELEEYAREGAIASA